MQRSLMTATIAGGVLTIASAVLAGGLEMNRSVIANGGGAASGATFSLVSTVGQPGAGTMTGGSFQLDGGFLHAGAMAPTCPGDTDGDNVIDVNDLNNVILDWGSDGSANGGDLTGALPGSPPDGVVDVNDLNAIFVSWGACGVT